MQQAEVSTSAIFLTLTYDNENCPITPNGFATLCKRDLQLFFKRLRKLCKQTARTLRSERIKYFAVGEYGSMTKRPHYHAILFNASSEQCDIAWSKGHTYVGTLTTSSIAYTLKYVHKERMPKRFDRDDRLREFSVMSKGLGSNFLDNDENVRYLKSRLNDPTLIVKGGHRMAIPRYYKEKVFTDEEREQIRLHMEAIAGEEVNMSHSEQEYLLQYKNEVQRRNRKKGESRL